MKYSRRDLSVLLPAFAAIASAAEEPDQHETLTSQVYQNAKVPYTGTAQKKGRRFVYAKTHSGFAVEIHETDLGPGVETHPPHKHEHEELVIVVEGTAEASLNGRKELAPAGSVIVFGSNQMHNLRNAGATACRYYVIELRGKEA